MGLEREREEDRDSCLSPRRAGLTRFRADSSEASFYTQNVVHSQVKPDLQTDDLSPVSSTFGHDVVERSCFSLAMPADRNPKDWVHRIARQTNGINTMQEQTILESHFPCQGQSDPTSYADLELVITTLHAPFQLSQLERLFYYLRRTPDIHQPLTTTRYPPFPYLVDVFFQHLSSRSHTAGGESQDDLLRAFSDCFCHFIDHGADPNIIVGETPLLFRLLEAPKATGAFGPLWEFVQRLAKRALPVIQQQQQQQDYSNSVGAVAMPNVLHVLLKGTASDPALPMASEAQNRVNLTADVLIPRLAGLGRLDDRDAQGLSAFRLYARDFAGREATHHFLRVSAEFVRCGADAGGTIVPPGFAAEVQAACRTGSLSQRMMRHQGGQGGGGAAALLSTVWISACRLSAIGGDEAVIEDHLSLLECWTEGQPSAEFCRFLLPRPPSSPSPSQSVDLASPETGSEGSDEGNYTW